MKTVERFAEELVDQDSIEAWHKRLFLMGRDLGYDYASLAIFQNRDTPIAVANAFLHTNFPDELLSKYDRENMGEIDPIVCHCMARSTALVWSPAIFSAPQQKQLYEEACGHGIRSGVTLPCHGPNGEFGMLSFASGAQPDEHFEQETMRNVPELSCFRDFIFETFCGFMKRPSLTKGDIDLSARELECLKWCATGKSSWDIAQLMNCTEATVNFHFANIRRKFGASSRRLAIVQAIRLGFISV